jgi:hypothetical protein
MPDPIEENIELPQGADYEEVEWITDDNDNPIDISGDTFRAEVRIAPGEPLLASFTFEIFLDDGIYKYRRTMAQSVINALDETEAEWDQFREHADGFSEKIFFGKVKIPANITSPTV